MSPSTARWPGCGGAGRSWISRKASTTRWGLTRSAIRWLGEHGRHRVSGAADPHERVPPGPGLEVEVGVGDGIGQRGEVRALGGVPLGGVAARRRSRSAADVAAPGDLGPSLRIVIPPVYPSGGRRSRMTVARAVGSWASIAASSARARVDLRPAIPTQFSGGVDRSFASPRRPVPKSHRRTTSSPRMRPLARGGHILGEVWPLGEPLELADVPPSGGRRSRRGS